MIVRHHRILATVAAVALLGTVGAPSATASSDGHLHRREELNFTSTSSRPTVILAQDCNTQAGVCLLPFIGYDTVAGDLAGTQVNSGAISVNPVTFVGPGVALASFSGTVTGCPGVGFATFRYKVNLGVTPGHNVGTFEVVQGSGVAGLAGLSGHAEFLATVQPDGNVSSVGTADFKCDD